MFTFIPLNTLPLRLEVRLVVSNLFLVGPRDLYGHRSHDKVGRSLFHVTTYSQSD